MKGWLVSLVGAVLLGPGGSALAETVTVTVKDVNSGQGRVVASLCTDEARFPGGVCPHQGEAPASSGETTVVIRDVPAGRYALQVMHDANGNGRLDLPAEGFGFGNNAPYPPRFENAVITVAQDAKAQVGITYLSRVGAAAVEVGAPARTGVIKTAVRENGLYGAFYAPEGARDLPVIIAIGGSEGGLDTISALASPLASHGYAVLALAYWRAPGLPQTLENVPLEYFSRAIDWLEPRREVDRRRVGMFGWSRGGEGALLIAAHDPRIRAVVGMSPGSHVLVGLNFADMAHLKPAWTLKGEALPYYAIPGNGMGAGMTMRQMMDGGLAEAARHPEAEIPVERINGPVLLISGSEDAIWDGATNSERVLKRLKQHRFRFPARHIDYPGAGHLVFAGDPAAQSFQFDAATKAMMGGSDPANAAARRDSWEKVLGFFDMALKARRR